MIIIASLNLCIIGYLKQLAMSHMITYVSDKVGIRPLLVNLSPPTPPFSPVKNNDDQIKEGNPYSI